MRSREIDCCRNGNDVTQIESNWRKEIVEKLPRRGIWTIFTITATETRRRKRRCNLQMCLFRLEVD